MIIKLCVCSGDVEQIEGASKITIRIFKNVTLIHEGGMVLLEVSLNIDVSFNIHSRTVKSLLFPRPRLHEQRREFSLCTIINEMSLSVE